MACVQTSGLARQTTLSSFVKHNASQNDEVGDGTLGTFALGAGSAMTVQRAGRRERRRGGDEGRRALYGADSSGGEGGEEAAEPAAAAARTHAGFGPRRKPVRRSAAEGRLRSISRSTSLSTSRAASPARGHACTADDSTVVLEVAAAAADEAGTAAARRRESVLAEQATRAIVEAAAAKATEKAAANTTAKAARRRRSRSTSLSTAVSSGAVQAQTKEERADARPGDRGAPAITDERRARPQRVPQKPKERLFEGECSRRLTVTFHANTAHNLTRLP